MAKKSVELSILDSRSFDFDYEVGKVKLQINTGKLELKSFIKKVLSQLDPQFEKVLKSNYNLDSKNERYTFSNCVEWAEQQVTIKAVAENHVLAVVMEQIQSTIETLYNEKRIVITPERFTVGAS